MHPARGGVYGIRGNPTEEELAAVVVAVTTWVSTAVVASAAAGPYGRARRWNQRVQQMTHQLAEHGSGAWLRSILR
ncbi:acyl-CoA carboxylase epsilon subunit [Streptomyces sp. 7N604]|uniref:acyl-CoA carboxylase epsilon subunit n=1 Tax=Streptomyces sp. 7N604 TaxID=3457415 RepID=UPI003FD03DDF